MKRGSTMTIQEIEEFVQSDLSYLNLSVREKTRIINYIKNLDIHYRLHKKNYLKATDEFLKKLEDCTEFFKGQGFDEETSLKFAGKTVIFYDNQNFKDKLSFLRVVNLEEKILMRDAFGLRFNLEKAHAKKSFLVDINNKDKQTESFLLQANDKRVQNRFNIELKELTQKYHLSQETKEVWMIIGTMNNQQFKDFFNLTREELSYIYPTTKEELATLHKIAAMTDDKIKESYGLNRQELLQKKPLNIDTLNALKSIKISSDKAIENTFHKTRQELLELRTITTDMIRIAQRERLILKGTILTKDQLREQFKTMKKGTYPNG